MTEVAWAYKGKDLEARAQGMPHKLMFHLRRPMFEASWEQRRTRPGIGDKTTAAFFRILPKFVPLNVFQFHTPADETEQLFGDSLKATVADYEARAGSAPLAPPNINLDTGRPIHPGQYRYGDMTFARWLDRLARAHFASINPAMRESLLGFYDDTTRDGMNKDGRKWREIQRELRELQASGIR